jgi:hypothetical protein
MIVYLVALIFGDHIAHVLTFRTKDTANEQYNIWYGMYGGGDTRVEIKEIDLGA